MHSNTDGWFCSVHSRATPATIFRAVARSTNAPSKSATIKTTTIWFLSDIGFSFLTASKVALALTEQQSPRKSGCFKETEVSIVKKPYYSSLVHPSVRSVPPTDLHLPVSEIQQP
jgi:hypothetical protein